MSNKESPTGGWGNLHLRDAFYTPPVPRNTPIIVGVTVGVGTLIIIGFLLFVFKRRRDRKIAAAEAPAIEEANGRNPPPVLNELRRPPMVLGDDRYDPNIVRQEMGSGAGRAASAAT